MATGKRPDPQKRKKAHQHATYLTVKNGERHPAYLAGELYGCYTHRTYAAQPCHSDITEGELQCPYCAAGMVPEWRGYVPLWDRDWTLRYALIGEDYYATVDAIAHHAQVVVSRAKNPISPLVIREEVLLTRQLPQTSPWRDAVLMLPICLTLWKCDPLTQWCQSRKLLAMGTATPAPAAPKGIPAAPKVSAIVTPYSAPGEGATEVQYDAVVNRLKKNKDRLAPSTNGAHKSDPK